MMATQKVFSLFKTRSYKEIFPNNIDILGNKVDFFLECTTYDMILPVRVKEKSKLDIFEEAVLRFMNFKVTSSKEIADSLCLTPDLINFIIIRLKEMEFLKENGKDLTEQGKNYIDSSLNNKENTNIEYRQAKLFVLNQTGDILPYIQTGEFINEPVEDIQKKCLTLGYGTTGNPIKVKGEILCQDKKTNEIKGSLSNKEIRKALWRYNRIAKRNRQYKTIKYAPEWAIDNTSSDNVYFHMQAIIQDGNSDDILVTDGFVINVDFINQYIKEKHSEFIQKVKEKATKNGLKNDEINYTQNKVINNLKYKELNKLMNKINSSLDLYESNKEEQVLNLDQNKEFQNKQKNFLLNCYSALEWCLYYYNLRNPIPEPMNTVIESQNAHQNEETILQMAKKIAIEHPERYEDLFYTLDRKRMDRMFKDKTPELRVALSMAIISAANDENNCFRKLLKVQSDLFRVLKDLFKEHGDLSHQTVTYDIDRTRNKKIYKLLINFIENLIPDYKIDDKKVQNQSIDFISQERLNAEVSLRRELGTIYFESLPETIRNEWMLIVLNKTKYLEIYEYFNVLYRIMQDTLFYALKEMKKNPFLTKEKILSKLKALNIQLNSLETVKEVFIKQIALNENATLGANALVYLYCLQDSYQIDKLKQLIENEFIKVIEELVQLRKHGNNIMFNVEISKLNQLRNKLLKIVKVIGEI